MNIYYLQKKWLKIIIAVLTIFIGFGFASLALGIVNPAATYCQDLGYEWVIEQTKEGEIGVCKFPDGSTLEDWDFLKGKNGQEWSYCEKRGYTLKTISDVDKCSPIFSEDCAVCVLEEGIEIEVSKLLGFETQKENCGNKVCDPGENQENCPQDCLEKKKSLWLYIGILFIMVVLCVLIYKGIKKWRTRKALKIMPKV